MYNFNLKVDVKPPTPPARKYTDGARVVVYGYPAKVVSAVWLTYPIGRSGQWEYELVDKDGKNRWALEQNISPAPRLPRLELYDDKQKKQVYYRLVDGDGKPVVK